MVEPDPVQLQTLLQHRDGARLIAPVSQDAAQTGVRSGNTSPVVPLPVEAAALNTPPTNDREWLIDSLMRYWALLAPLS